MYKFDLEPLLNHRRNQEEVLQKKLAESRIRLTAEQKKLRKLKEKKREYAHTLRSLQKKTGTVSDLILYLRYLDHLDGYYLYHHLPLRIYKYQALQFFSLHDIHQFFSSSHFDLVR